MRKFLIPLLISSSVFAESIPGNELLSYFSANCRTQGEWTRSALADSTALIQTLRTLSQDPDCRSVSGAIAQLELLTQQLSNLEKINSTKVQIAEINSSEQELMIQLSNTTNPTVQSEINSQLRSLQLKRAGLVGRDQAQNDLVGPDKAQLMQGVIQVANTTFSQLVGNQKCIGKNASVLNTATGIISAIGATAAVVNPALGLGVSAGATFLGETIEGIRQLGYTRSIRKLSDNSIAFEAYKCALETMSERWCQMKDAEKFLLFKASRRQADIEKTDLSTAVRLNDREIPVLLEWLNKIRSGVTPTTTADASRQSVSFQREALVRSLEAEGVGLIEQNRAIYNSYTNLDDRWIFLRGLTNTLIPATATAVKNPMYDIFAVGYSPYFMLGLADDQSIRNTNGDYIPFLAWQKPIGFHPTIDLVKQKYLEWINLARNRVNQELNQVLQPDALQTLSSAFDRTDNRLKISPMDSLKAIITFLKQNPPAASQPAFRKVHESTLKKLEEIYQITQYAVMTDINSTSVDENGVERLPVEAIYEIAQLKYGTVVIQSRLDMIVRLSLIELLANSSSTDQTVVAQLLAAERFSEALAKMSGTDNLAVIRADINRAQPITISNLNSFINVFGKNINKILKRLQKEELESTGTIAASKRYARTEMCYLLLSVPNLKDQVEVKLCEGVQLRAVLPGGPAAKPITSQMFQVDLNDRACTYRDFFRSSKIYENWGIQ